MEVRNYAYQWFRALYGLSERTKVINRKSINAVLIYPMFIRRIWDLLAKANIPICLLMQRKDCCRPETRVRSMDRATKTG